MATRIPRSTSFDETLAWVRDPYGFVRARCRRYGSDLFETRLFLQRTICMTGPEAAQLFYDPDRFIRHGAMPSRVQHPWHGKGGIQELDDAAHRHRKLMFMALTSPEQIADLATLARLQLRVYAKDWDAKDQVDLLNELREVLTRAVCAWSGVPLPEAEVPRLTRELTAMLDAAGTIGPRLWRSRRARRQVEKRIAQVVADVRAGRLHPSEQSPLHVIALHRDLDGKLLPPQIAAVEVLNVLVPTVAVSGFITLAAHALHQHPDCRQRLHDNEADFADYFTQEVRRFYPYFPPVLALTRREFSWKDYLFPKGMRVMLDLHGTNRDPRSWSAADAFRPERFRTWEGDAFSFIPQGGGNHYQGHRCPGESMTLELTKAALDVLVDHISYDVPEQDLRIGPSRLPALPRRRFVISNVRVVG